MASHRESVQSMIGSAILALLGAWGCGPAFEADPPGSPSELPGSIMRSACSGGEAASDFVLTSQDIGCDFDVAPGDRLLFTLRQAAEVGDEEQVTVSHCEAPPTCDSLPFTVRIASDDGETVVVELTSAHSEGDMLSGLYRVERCPSVPCDDDRSVP